MTEERKKSETIFKSLKCSEEFIILLAEIPLAFIIQPSDKILED